MIGMGMERKYSGKVTENCTQEQHMSKLHFIPMNIGPRYQFSVFLISNNRCWSLKVFLFCLMEATLPMTRAQKEYIYSKQRETIRISVDMFDIFEGFQRSSSSEVFA